MLIDRALVLRALDIVSVSDISQITISKDGNVCHISPDRTVIVYGNTKLKLDEDWVLPDIGLFVGMLKAFISPNIDVVRSRNSFSMVGDGIQWRYRLGNKDAIQVIQPDVVEDLLSTLEPPTFVSIDTMKKIAGIQSTIKAAFIHFISKDGNFRVQVGEHDTYSGTIDFEYNPKEDFDVKIPANRLVEVVGKIDSQSVNIRFGLTGRRVVRVELPEFSWIIGAVKEVENGRVDTKY